MQRCLAFIAVMLVQAVEAFVTGLAHAALPSLPHPGGCVGSPQPMRLSPGPATTSAAGASLPLITFRSFSPPPPLVTEAPGVRSNPISAPVPPQIPEPAFSQNRYEALR